MSVTKVLLDILVVLLAAKLAAELAERVKLPAVVGEIVAGIIIGPSALALVHGDEVLRVLGELGVILLLLEVGMEMDLRELGAVGRASLTVATVGVVVPFAGGFFAGEALGMSTNEALFVGAALTATSVGITARVFGDLRALASVEARTVLGAAVADDVMGLVILTVVVRLVTEGSVSVGTVATVVLVAVLFLALSLLVGVRVTPWIFNFVAKVSRSSGTMVAIAIAFALGFAEVANSAKLAPIVGAFVAGVCIGRSPSSDRIRREITPIGHLLVPVFFLQVGIDADISRFGDPSVLGIAAALLGVAIVGKMVSAFGLLGAPGDRLLVGLGMLPRGEVGLIFATIGLREGVFGEDVYAALLLVVLVTTLVTPPLLRLRLLKVRSRTLHRPTTPRPEGGWVQVKGAGDNRQVDLEGEPPVVAALQVALEAALLGDQARPGPRLLQWLSELPDTPLQWTRDSRAGFFKLLLEGGPRSWRFLTLTGVLDRALPELGEALARRQADPFELDPMGAMRWPLLSALRERGGLTSLAHPERALLAAIVLDATHQEEPAVPLARRIIHRLDLGAGDEQAVAGLVGDVHLLSSAARRSDSLEEERVLQLAVHIGSAEQARALYLLTRAGEGLEPWEHVRLDELHDLVQAALARPELTGRGARNAVEQRRAAATRLVTGAAVHDRIAHAPRAYVLATPPERLARQASMCEPPPASHDVRVAINQAPDGDWLVDIVTRDRTGLLASETFVLSELGYDVAEANAVAWGDRCAVASFTLRGTFAPDADTVATALRVAVDQPLSSPALSDLTVDFDNDSSPWHTLCRVEAPDHPGLLHAITTSFAAAGARVSSTRVSTTNNRAVDNFALTDNDGEKLSQRHQDSVRAALRDGVQPRKRWSARRNMAKVPLVSHVSETSQENDIDRQRSGDDLETPEPYAQG